MRSLFKTHDGVSTEMDSWDMMPSQLSRRHRTDLSASTWLIIHMCVNEQLKVAGMSHVGSNSIYFHWLQVSLQWLQCKLWEAEGESCKLSGTVNSNLLHLVGTWFDTNWLVSQPCKTLTPTPAILSKCGQQPFKLYLWSTEKQWIISFHSL